MRLTISGTGFGVALLAITLLSGCASVPLTTPSELAPAVSYGERLDNLALGWVRLGYEPQNREAGEVIRRALHNTLQDSNLFSPSAETVIYITVDRLELQYPQVATTFNAEATAEYTVASSQDGFIAKKMIVSVGSSAWNEHFMGYTRREAAIKRALRNNLKDFMRVLREFLERYSVSLDERDKEAVAKTRKADSTQASEGTPAVRGSRPQPASVSKDSRGPIPERHELRSARISELVRAVQQHLAQLGYDPGPFDGTAGQRTVAAIRAFQRDNNINPDGVISESLLALLRIAVAVAESERQEPESEPDVIGSGTGFIVNQVGYAVTNYHVVDDCKSIRVVEGRELYDASLAASDEQNDLAVLKLSDRQKAAATFRSVPRAQLGENIVVAGYPLRGILAEDLAITTGTISALAGLHNRPGLLQISAPVQRGNSGGPLLDNSGHVVGVVVAKLDALWVAKHIGDIPQNVNFAVKGSLVKSFLDIHRVDYEARKSEQPLDNKDIAAKAREFTVAIECLK